MEEELNQKGKIRVNLPDPFLIQIQSHWSLDTANNVFGLITKFISLGAALISFIGLLYFLVYINYYDIDPLSSPSIVLVILPLLGLFSLILITLVFISVSGSGYYIYLLNDSINTPQNKLPLQVPIQYILYVFLPVALVLFTPIGSLNTGEASICIILYYSTTALIFSCLHSSFKVNTLVKYISIPFVISFFALLSIFVLIIYSIKTELFFISDDYIPYSLWVVFVIFLLTNIPTMIAIGFRPDNDADFSSWIKKIIPVIILFFLLLPLALPNTYLIPKAIMTLFNIGGEIDRHYYLHKHNMSKLPDSFMLCCDDKLCATIKLPVILDLGNKIYVKNPAWKPKQNKSHVQLSERSPNTWQSIELPGDILYKVTGKSWKPDCSLY